VADNEIDPRHRDAVQREIERLIADPPARRAAQAIDWKKEADNTAGNDYFESLMDLAVRKSKLSREEIIRLWGKEDHPEPVSKTAVARETALTRARRANMPDKYRESVIDRDPVDCQALKAVKSFLSGRRKLLMLSGGRGTYKSGSSCYAIGQIEGSRYVDAIELVDIKLRDAERYRELMGARLVVLDDIGLEDKKPAQRSMFLDAWMRLVVNAYTRGGRLIVTGNVLWTDFKRHEDEGGYGVLAADRWTESGEWHDIEGDSVRPALRDRPHWTEREPGEEG